MKKITGVFLMAGILWLFAACAPAAPSTPAAHATATPTVTASPSLTPTATVTLAPTATATVTPSPTPIGGSPLAIVYSNLQQLLPNAANPVESASLNLAHPGDAEIRQLVAFDENGQSVLDAKNNWLDYLVVRLAPDRNSAVFSFGGAAMREITVVNLETGTAETVLELPLKTVVEELEWSPNGQWIAVTHYPYGSPRLSTTFVSLADGRSILTGCSSVKEWREDAEQVICLKDYGDILYQFHLKDQSEQVFTWPTSKIFDLTKQNLFYVQGFPEIDSVLVEEMDDQTLYLVKNYHLILQEYVSRADIQEFLDGRVVVAEYPGNNVWFQRAKLSPDHRRIMITGINERGSGYWQGIDPIAFTHVYEIGDEPLDLAGEGVVNHLWGIEWSPDSASILALKGLWHNREELPPPDQLLVDLVILDADTLEEVWTMTGDPNQALLGNVTLYNDVIGQFDAGWQRR